MCEHPKPTHGQGIRMSERLSELITNIETLSPEEQTELHFRLDEAICDFRRRKKATGWTGQRPGDYTDA